jgi:hypothetical protein
MSSAVADLPILGDDLTLRRLEHRARRLRFAILTLRERRAFLRPSGAAALARAIDDFSADLDAVELQIEAVNDPRDTEGRSRSRSTASPARTERDRGRTATFSG